MPYIGISASKRRFLNRRKKSSLLLIIPHGACGCDSRMSLTGGMKCLFGRGGHRFDKHGRATRRNIRRIAKGRSLTGGHLIFSQAARQASRRTATRRVKSDRNSARDLARLYTRKRRSKRRDLSAFNGPALVKSCTETLSTTLSKLYQQGLVANSWPRLPSYFEINGDLFMGDDTVPSLSESSSQRKRLFSGKAPLPETL